MDKKRLKPFLFILLLVLVIISSVFYSIRKNNKVSKIDTLINKYETKLIEQDYYLSDSSYLNIDIEEQDSLVIFTFSAKVEVEDVIILISNGRNSMNYGIKDEVGSDFVLDDFDKDNGKVKGAKLLFDKASEYYIYLSFYYNDSLVEEYIHI